MNDTLRPQTDRGTVDYESDAGIARITLNRPETLNAMNDDLMLDLSQALGFVIDDPAIRVAVLTGAGRGFCSGADLGGIAADDPAGMGDRSAAGMDDVFHPAIRRLAELPVPTIARVNGVAAGGGFGLALGCDIVVAAQSARFVATFGPRLGIVPDLGTTHHLPRLVGQARARGIAMLGDSISATQAADWGLIWSVVDDADLDVAVGELAGRLSRSSPEAMARIRSALAAAPSNTLDTQLDLERDHQRVLIPQNMVVGAQAFLDKRDPTFDGTRWSK